MTNESDFARVREALNGHIKCVNWSAFQRNDRLKRILVELIQRGRYSMTLGEGASIACLAPPYFSTYFRAKVGITFSSWIQVMQVTQAFGLIVDERKSPSEVVDLAGYRNRRTFERVFRKLTGTSASRLDRIVDALRDRES